MHQISLIEVKSTSEMEEEGVKSIGEGGGDKLLQLLAEVEEAAEEVILTFCQSCVCTCVFRL